MPSIIEGYNYDIFISYRQKDNKYDGWVTEFVENLKKELEATFKEDISVYFDINPHDGLLDTHDVGESLKEKLKCLIFIPIISRTYCDPKSFAWEHEFKAFVEQASNDQFGLKVRLPNGNVSSRVLPVRIHDLDAYDIEECESALGGVLRSIDFVYKEPGVDKPLSPGDNEKKNLSNTNYRIQIIKVAHSIKEIFSGLKTSAESRKETTQLPESSEEAKKTERSKTHEGPAIPIKRRLLAGGIVVTLLLIASLLVYSTFFKPNTLQKLRSSGEKISVAVMPFLNMTNDTLWNIWQEGIKDILVSFLSASEELNVRDPESVRSIFDNEGLSYYASITPSAARAISRKLEADVYINGNLKMSGNTVRLYAQLIDSRSAVVFKSFQTEGKNDEEKIFGLIDSLSIAIRDFLVIQELKKGHSNETQNVVFTYSPDAYRYFMQGVKLFSSRDYSSARKLFSKAIAIDSNMIVALLYTSVSYGNQGLYDQAKDWCIRAYNKREFLPIRVKVYTEWLYANYFETPYEEIVSLKKLIAIDDQAPRPYYLLGLAYQSLHEYENAISAYVKKMEIAKRWGMKVEWVYDYIVLGEAYHKVGKYREEKKIYKKAVLEFPDDPEILYREAVLALYKGKTGVANSIIEKYSAVQKEKSIPESLILADLADIYKEAGIANRAEDYCRKALSIDPENTARINALAWMLIDTGTDINEGLGLIDKALELSPDNCDYLDTKGWGLYKQGKYKEALELLEKSWSLKPIYDHTIYLHLEEVKKAISGMKNN